MQCASCKKSNTFRAWEGPLDIGGVEITARGQRCDGCGETLFDSAEIERQENAIAHALVTRGIRRGPEFKLVRKAAGFRATEVAELFGVRPETVSRWERDEVELPRTAAFALGQLFEHPKITQQKLNELARAVSTDR